MTTSDRRPAPGTLRFALRLVMIWLSQRGLTAAEIAALLVAQSPLRGALLRNPFTLIDLCNASLTSETWRSSSS